ncbi:hypothetical protein CVT25_010461 [Psilocybe cyanescens]|uniref:Uncharacterized protein n=1 Tax=Psilocybe cyanescens TaxID=93625 RepID=A0A409XDI2_PSICY|nr:hypothetical protein CVT25_010461 [Psilocybe cyanescens]
MDVDFSVKEDRDCSVLRNVSAVSSCVVYVSNPPPFAFSSFDFNVFIIHMRIHVKKHIPTKMSQSSLSLLPSAMIYVLTGLYDQPLGLVTDICLFIATNICKLIIWKAFSPTTVNIRRGSEFEGALIVLVHLLFTWHDKGRALREAFWREGLPNFMSLILTVAIFAVMIYLQGFTIEIPVKSNRCSTQLQSALTSNVFIVSNKLATRFPRNFSVKVLGVWESLGDSLQLWATGRITYYMSPPHTLKEAVLDWIHAATYIPFTLSACALFSKTPQDVVKQLKDKPMVGFYLGYLHWNSAPHFHFHIPNATPYHATPPT